MSCVAVWRLSSHSTNTCICCPVAPIFRFEVKAISLPAMTNPRLADLCMEEVPQGQHGNRPIMRFH